MNKQLEIYITKEATNELVQEEIQMKGYWLPIVVKYDKKTFDIIAVTPECFINGYENEIKSGRLPNLENDIIVQNLNTFSIVTRVIELSKIGYFENKVPIDLNKKYESIWQELKELKNWVKIYPDK